MAYVKAYYVVSQHLLYTMLHKSVWLEGTGIIAGPQWALGQWDL